MTDNLLRSLRANLLDETEPLAGLLRKCLMLGAETGSQSLREWARAELKGYDEESEVPGYRRVEGISLVMSSVSGRWTMSNQHVDRLQIPKEAREYVLEEVHFRQPVEELEELAATGTVRFSNSGLALAQSIMNQSMGAFQAVTSLSYQLSGSVLTGMLGQIRTHLVDLVSELTADTPLTEMPRKEQVDAAVGQVYNTTIHGSSAPVAIGSSASATIQGLTVEDALKLLEGVQQAAEAATGVDTAELVRAVNELRELVQQESPSTGEVIKKAGKLRAIVEKLGVGAVSAAASSAVTSLTELAMSGAFG